MSNAFTNVADQLAMGTCVTNVFIRCSPTHCSRQRTDASQASLVPVVELKGIVCSKDKPCAPSVPTSNNVKLSSGAEACVTSLTPQLSVGRGATQWRLDTFLSPWWWVSTTHVQASASMASTRRDVDGIDIPLMATTKTVHTWAARALYVPVHTAPSLVGALDTRTELSLKRKSCMTSQPIAPHGVAVRRVGCLRSLGL